MPHRIMLQALRRRVGRWWHAMGDRRRAGPARAAVVDQPTASDARQYCEAGLNWLKASRHDEALACFRSAIAASPRSAEAHYWAGIALREAGRHEEAVASFQRAIELQHDHVPALTHQGWACLELGRREDAVDCFNLALAFDPDCVAAHLALAKLEAAENRHAEAIGHFERAADLDPQSPVPLISLSALMQSLAQYDRALACLQRAAALAPEVAEVQHNLGVLCLKLDRPGEASSHLERAVALREDFPEAHLNLGTALLACDNANEAIASYQRAIALRPGYAEAHHDLGNVYRFRGDLDGALAAYQKALTLQPDYAQAHLDIGVVRYDQGRIQDAIACYQEALAIQPDFPEAQLNLALAWLTIGDFGRGWAGYDWRFRQTAKDNRVIKRALPWPQWQGEELAGRSILIWAEQGIGDQLVFASLFGEVMRDARLCAIECAAKLAPLFARSFPAARVVALASPPHPDLDQQPQQFDYQVAAGSIARWRRPSLESFPARAAYLVPDAGRVRHWRRRLDELGPGLKVGFCWRSRNLRGERALSCTDILQWGEILRVARVHFVSLQYDECAAELTAATQRFGVALHAFPEVDLFDDLDEAAALTQALDLVIAAPTAASILAAAVGVPTWQMSYGFDWQTHGTQGNPWLPAIVRFQRRWDQEWDEVIGEIARRLGDLARRGPPAPVPPSSIEPARSPPAAVEAEIARGDELLRAGNAAEAAAYYERAMRIDGGAVGAQLGLGRALRELDRLPDSERRLERLAAAEPHSLAARLELGITRYHLGRYEEAQHAFGSALALDPGNLPARMNRALTLYQQGEFEMAAGAYDEILAQHPDHTDAHFNLSLALLARGDLTRGWKEYDWRFGREEWDARERSFPFPRWAGQDLAGKAILVWKEQSVGSQILFASLFPELIERAAYCIIECSDKLVPLFARSFPDSDVVPRTEPPHPYTQHGIDYQAAAGSVARWLRPALPGFPRHRGYLVADPQRVAYWRSRLQALGPGPKVGFSWRSINTRGERALACTELDDWGPVFGVGGLHFVNLQYDHCDNELTAASGRHGVVLNRFGEIDMFNDIDETAALIGALDLVVSAPTAVSVLAAALGAPTWQLHHGSDWQMHSAHPHPWFPAMRRFQRGLYQPWPEVLMQVGVALRQFAGGGER